MSVESKVSTELKKIFSNPRTETLEGVIAVGGRLNPELLVHAYAHGIFPWPHQGYPLLWFCPDERGVIDFSELHIPRSFHKWLKKNRALFTITINERFQEVVKNCKTQRRAGQQGTWITKEIEENYLALHKKGQAFSLEVLRGDELVGGIYGVQSKKYVSCESMFHKIDNTSKLALYELIHYLQGIGHRWVDIQMLTSVCKSFGGKLISKNEFLNRIGY